MSRNKLYWFVLCVGFIPARIGMSEQKQNFIVNRAFGVGGQSLAGSHVILLHWFLPSMTDCKIWLLMAPGSFSLCRMADLLTRDTIRLHVFHVISTKHTSLSGATILVAKVPVSCLYGSTSY
jgi:hypothetical protein